MESGTATDGMMVAAKVAQEKEDDHDHQRDGEHQLEFDVFHGGADGGGAVGEDVDLDDWREGWSATAASSLWMRSTTAMMLAPGWR